MKHDFSVKTTEFCRRGRIYKADFYVDGDFLRANVCGKAQSIMCDRLPADVLMLALLAERIMELEAMPPPQKRRFWAAAI